MKDTDRKYSDKEENSAFDYGEEENEPEQEETDSEEKRGGLKLLTSIQIFGSLAVLAAAIVLRMLGGDTYQKARAWYLSAVNDSIVAEEQIDQARRTVVGLWNNISAAGLKSTSNESQAQSESKGTESQQQAAPSSNPESSTAQTSS